MRANGGMCHRPAIEWRGKVQTYEVRNLRNVSLLCLVLDGDSLSAATSTGNKYTASTMP
mgnify:CR=1 FL=1